MDENREIWRKCAEFHGHECGGLTIGYKASLYAIELLELKLGGGGDAGCLSADEEIVCISENDACGVDAIQVVLGCSVGKGNLLFHMRGKQAFSFYDRNSGKSVRLVLRPKPAGLAKEKSINYYQTHEPRELFDVKPVKLELPEEARIFDSITCTKCGETAGSNWIRVLDGECVCEDCYESYDRFNV